jgi:hypothetical protein
MAISTERRVIMDHSKEGKATLYMAISIPGLFNDSA